MVKNVLLISNSKVAGGKLLDHARGEIKDLLGERKRVLFIPWANPGGMGYGQYTQALVPVFDEMGHELISIEIYRSGVKEHLPDEAIKGQEAIFVGGGNTWQLLQAMKNNCLNYLIRKAVHEGIPYIGSSAGANIAGLTIGNTNDMPSAESYGREALGLVPFNINPHYQDTIQLTAEERRRVLEVAPQLKMILDHQGETRDQRLKEYHALGNQETVVALREGAMIRVRGDNFYVRGTTGAKIFKPNKEPVELKPGDSLDSLL